MGPGEAIVAGFADLYVPEAAWEVLKAQLCETGDILALGGASQPAPDIAMPLDQIDQLFAPADLAGILAAHQADDSDFAAKTLKTLLRNSPLSMALTLKMVRQQRADGPNIRDALAQEYRVAHRILEHGDFIEGVRAQIIDKDRNPSWKHASDGVSDADVLALLAPLGDREWSMS
jgi:enoyl-CoA hydratase/carnithine racemase